MESLKDQCCVEKTQWLTTDLLQKSNKLKDNLFKISECLLRARQIAWIYKNLPSDSECTNPKVNENTIKQVAYDMWDLIDFTATIIDDFDSLLGEIE